MHRAIGIEDCSLCSAGVFSLPVQSSRLRPRDESPRGRLLAKTVSEQWKISLERTC